MKEIFHKDNAHLEAPKKILAELEQHGFVTEYLGYSDAPVSSLTRDPQTSSSGHRLIFTRRS
jgi:hypothetical protein